MRQSQRLKKEAEELMKKFFNADSPQLFIDVNLVDWKNPQGETNGLLSIMFRAKESEDGLHQTDPTNDRKSPKSD